MSETYNLTEIPRHSGIIDAALCIDTVEVGIEAFELITNYESESRIISQAEAIHNARTAMTEALTASGHLSRVEVTCDTLEEVNAYMRHLVLRGWKEDLPDHEKRRIFFELCEELIVERTHLDIANGVIDKSTKVGLITNYPDDLDDKTAGKLGYRKENKKGFSRSSEIQFNLDGSVTRVIESVSQSNSHDASAYYFLRDSGIQVESSGDLAVMAKPFMFSSEDYIDGVVDIQRIIDGYRGTDARYGEVSNSRHVDYEDLREHSQKLDQAIEPQANRLADYEIKLNEICRAGKISREQKDSQYNEQLVTYLRAICVVSPDLTADCFGDQSVAIYEQAAIYVAQGDLCSAEQWILEHTHLEKPVVICGFSISAKEAKALGIELDSLDDSIKEAKANWPWKLGKCRAPFCDSQKKKEIVLVGPCSVCMKCQAIYDKQAENQLVAA
ncbi:MAG TPA: hypothetical protein VMR76_02155 [Candidatus Saccharimonadia bacterium]|nr:hypothetical protein [Candidatus Saccharimonadia bacterium]